MESLLLELEGIMNINQPINQDHPHFFGDSLLDVFFLFFLQAGHEVNDILFVFLDGVLAL